VDVKKVIPFLKPKKSLDDLKNAAYSYYKQKEYRQSVRYYSECLLQEENYQFFWY
jgi:membrane-bound lytic murein transglycosylase MltF